MLTGGDGRRRTGRGAGADGRRRTGGAASPARWAARLLGGLALLLAAFLAAGALLPSTLEVTRSVEIEASPEVIFPLLNDLEAWAEWTPWGEVESHVEGKSSGPGARRSWDDPQMGSGSLVILASEPPTRVAYLVEVEDGAIRFEGVLNVEATAYGAVVEWSEWADVGWNPLLRWTALAMDDSQGRQLEESLARLKEVAESR